MAYFQPCFIIGVLSGAPTVYHDWPQQMDRRAASTQPSLDSRTCDWPLQLGLDLHRFERRAGIAHGVFPPPFFFSLLFSSFSMCAGNWELDDLRRDQSMMIISILTRLSSAPTLQQMAQSRYSIINITGRVSCQALKSNRKCMYFVTRTSGSGIILDTELLSFCSRIQSLSARIVIARACARHCACYPALFIA